MATYTSYLVESSPGVDEYTTFASWLSAVTTRGTDLVTRGDNEILIINGTWHHSEVVDISGFTTGSANTFEVYVHDDHKHDGTPGSGWKVSGDGGSNTGLFEFSVAYGELRYLEAVNLSVDFRGGVYVDARETRIVSCIGEANGVAIQIANTSSATMSQWPAAVSCYAHDSGRGIGRASNSRQRYIAWNCVTVDNGTGFSNDGTVNDPQVINCVAFQNTTNWGTTNFDTSSSNNASGDYAGDPPPGSDPYTSDVVTADFVDPATQDYHLSASSGLLGEGANQSSEYTLDIDGDTYSVPYPIGMDQYVASGTTYEAALTFGLSSGVTPTRNATFEGSSTFGLSAGISQGNIATFEAAFAAAGLLQTLIAPNPNQIHGAVGLNLGTTLGTVPTSDISIEGALLIAQAVGIQQTTTRILEASATFDTSQGMDEGGTTVLYPSLTIGVTEGFTATSAIQGGVSIIEAALALAILEGYAAETNAEFSPTLTIGVVSDIQSINVANLFAASQFNSNLALQLDNGNVVTAAVAFALQHDYVTSLSFILDGTVSLGLSQALAQTGDTSVEGNLQLIQQLSVQGVASAILNAGLDLSTIKSISTNGSLVSLTLELPCGRTITVQVEDRTMTVGAENRTGTLSPGC